MRKLEDFKNSLKESNFINDSQLNMIVGMKRLMSKSTCFESTCNNGSEDCGATVDRDYDDGSTTSTYTELSRSCMEC